ncbi:Rho GTPase-activating protein 42 [Clonorchis sinensis]|uniref:Rho GTPase-activating protein 42 n=1 Tax=Clonorchis sinensis TaxID=79923 RepID=A0A8T1M5P0_CLOSI|nr:Rho GTPase-activating protein 42 [Clonorchis sinensis]
MDKSTAIFLNTGMTECNLAEESRRTLTAEPQACSGMPPLQPLEFRDCVVDGPHFRSALQNHEKELKAHGKLVKGVYSNAERVFKAMDAHLNKLGMSFLRNVLEVIEENGLETQGIYRISGVRLKVTALVRQAMSPPGLSKSVLSTYETHMLTSAVKHFVRNLDEPLVTFALHHEFIAAIKRNPSERVQEVARLINLLPRANQRALQLLMSHLAKVSAHSRVNSMTPSNLGIVFAPSVMRSPEETVAAIMNTKFASSVVELMIEHHATLFPSTDGELLDTLPMPVKEPVPIEPVYSTPVLDSKAPSPREARLVDLGLYRPAKADNATSILATVQHQPVVGDTPNASKAAGDVLGSNEDLPPRPPVPPRLGPHRSFQRQDSFPLPPSLTSPRRRQSEQNKRVLPSRPSEPSNRIIITHPQPINDDVDRPNIGQLVSSDNNSRGEPDKMEDLPPRVPGKIQRPHGQSAVGFPNVLSLTSAFNHQPSIPPQPPVRKSPT